MNDKRLKMLKDEPVNKAINYMAAPAIVGMMVMAIYNVVDSIFVSWIGDYEMAATQIVLPIMLVASSIGLALGMGGGSYISRLLGKNDVIEANKVGIVSFVTGAILGIIVTVINLSLLEPILNMFGADVNTLDLAKEYGTYIVIGYLFTILNMVMNNLLRSEGSAKYSMIGMVSGSIFNIILDPVFIFVFGWGIAGAALATTLSQILTSIILISWYLRKKTLISLNLKNFKPSVKIYTEILKIGIPTFLRQLLVSISLGILNNSASDISTDLVTAIGVVSRVTMIPMYIIFGFGQGFQPVAGYNFGAKNKDRVVDSFKYALKVSMLVMLVSCILFLVSGDLVFRIYHSGETVIEYGLPALRYYAIAILFMGVSNTVAVLYQAIGKGFEALILSVSRQGLFFIPLILILPNLIGLTGVIASQAIADLLTLILSVALILPFFTKNKLEKTMLKEASL